MNSNSSRVKICIVGGVPEPAGGVTNFLYRFTVHLDGWVEKIIDLYPHKNKWEVAGVDHIVRPKSKFLSIFWLIYQLFFCKAGVVYFNFSLPHSLSLLLFLPKKKGVKWALTLHHGELSQSMSNASNVIRRLSLKALQRIDRVGFIGGKQRSFYNEAAVHDACLYGISTYLPYVEKGLESPPADVSMVSHELAVFKKTFSKMVVASGYPTSLYRHDWVLSFFENRSSEAGLVLCLYGHDGEGLLATYREWAARLPNVIMFESLSPQGFQEVLKSSDIYVRATLTDSFGVAVAESIDCGLTVVASDACERAQGAFIFDHNDREAFESLLDDAVNEKLSRSIEFTDNGMKSIEKFLDFNVN